MRSTRAAPAGVYLFDSIRNEPRYAYGDKVGEFQQDEQFAEIYGGWSGGWRDGWVRRWTAGVTYDRSRYATVVDEPLGGPLPGDKELVYPWLGFDLVEDVYEERLNQDQIQRTEDVLLGLRAGARIGYAAEAFGSDRDALMLSLYAQDGWDFGRGRSLFATLAGSGRIEDDGLRNAVLSAEARFYARTSEKTKFFATVNGTVSKSWTHDRQLLLGGEEGLRGYPLRYQAGTSRALLTLEERYYTGLVPVPAVPRGGRGILRHGTDLGHRRHRRHQRRPAAGRRPRTATRFQPVGVRQRGAHRRGIPARRRRRHRRRAVRHRDEGTVLASPGCAARRLPTPPAPTS